MFDLGHGGADRCALRAMRPSLLPLLLPLLCASAGLARRPPPAVKEYYVAAVEIGWDYIYLDGADPSSDQR